LETVEQQAQTGDPGASAKTTPARAAFEIIETIVLAVVLFVGINAISARVRVDGISMRPTLQDGEFVLVSKLTYLWGDVERGDIIVFRFPLNPKEELIKRVIGLPGDHIRVENGQVYVNGQAIVEPYVFQPPLYSGEWTVEEDSLFVLGDNRNNSNDSKDWGFLPMENVVGRAILIYWPPPMWNVLEHADVFAAE
jgi:signal peptidase I